MATVEIQKQEIWEWKLSKTTGTHMTQSDYEELSRFGVEMSDEEARAYISEVCGFIPQRIRIVRKVNTYEVCRYQLRIAETFNRPPVQCSTDWNYFRFDCGSFQYELINGELKFYES